MALFQLKNLDSLIQKASGRLDAALGVDDITARTDSLLTRRLQRLRYLHRCSYCYRAERTSSRAGLPPAVDQRLSTAHFRVGAKK
jgi:hypothetical protein